MKTLRLTLYTLLLAGAASCGTQADSKEAATEATLAVDGTSADESVAAAPAADAAIRLINTVYDRFVFATDSDGRVRPEDYFTAGALAKLQADYTLDYDEGPCYAFYALRTEAQDSKTDDASSAIISIEPAADGWYVVSYSDMGWPGKTRVRVVDGKIDDYERMEP